MKIFSGLVRVIALMFVCFLVPVSAGNAENLKLITLGIDGEQGDSDSSAPRMSGDGRFIVFHSAASNLVAGDDEGHQDIFLYDREADSITRITEVAPGVGANGESDFPSITQNGRYIGFRSTANNIVPGVDGNSDEDCYLYDREQGTFSLVSSRPDGMAGNNISCARDGSEAVLFVTEDGHYAAYASLATDIVTPDTNGFQTDIFVKDLVSNTTTIVSRNSAGAQSDGPSQHATLTQDGKFVIFSSTGTNMNPDASSFRNVFSRNLDTGVTSLISEGFGGVPGDSSSSFPTADETVDLIAFHSDSSNLTPAMDSLNYSDIFLFDRNANTISQISNTPNGGIPNNHSFDPVISYDSSHIVFVSAASDLIATDTNSTVDCFVYSRALDSIIRINEKDDGTQSNGNCNLIAPDGVGHYVAFSSTAQNLDPRANSGNTHIYLAENDICPEDPTKLSPGVCGCGVSDDDNNGNGNADCLDPTADTVLSAPVLTKIKRRKITVGMQEFPEANVLYEIKLRSKINGIQVKKTKKGGASEVALKLPLGRWTVRYRVSAGSTKTGLSPRSKIKLS